MRKKKHIFTFRLTDKQPIKRILVRLHMIGAHERMQCENMLFVYGELSESCFLTISANDLCIHHHFQGVQEMFQLNLPK